jgi:archaellum component FlaC
LEELDNVAVKNVSEKELKKYVDHLRDMKITLENQLKTLKDAFTGIKKQQEITEAEFNA